MFSPCEKLRDVLTFQEQRRAFESLPAVMRYLILAAGMAGIVLWQATFINTPEQQDNRFWLKAVNGLTYQKNFVPFLYYTGLLPVATQAYWQLPASREQARRMLAGENARDLVTEVGITTRCGDLGRILIYLPEAWLTRWPQTATPMLVNILFFTVSLLALYYSFWKNGYPLLGLITTAILGSNPFQIYETYVHFKVFSWMISSAQMLLALHLPLMLPEQEAARDRETDFRIFWIPVLAGIFLGTVRHVRADPFSLIFPCAAVYAVTSGLSRRRKLSLVLILFLSGLLTSSAWTGWFQSRVREADRAVRNAGGEPFAGPRFRHHHLWHPVWCGLGDFDTKYGYAWDDRLSAAYALPVLREKYGMNAPDLQGMDWNYRTYWDSGTRYYRTPYELPHFMEVLRDKVLRDIVRDPLWYAGILARRLNRIAHELTPPHLAFGKHRIELYSFGRIALILMAGTLILTRSGLPLKIMGFMAGTSLIPLFIWSDYGMTWYTCYHLLIPVYLAAGSGELLLRIFQRIRNQVHACPSPASALSVPS